jgi:molecular chaperone DnaK (HSP70)
LQQLIHSHRLGMEPGEDPVIRIMVDEASAAAFFFLYRRIFEEPGGLPRFRYLYPRGLNMLLYDCGGGTTDIALVRASFDPEAKDVLRIKVLARSGLRGFGGDDITRAVCRIFKAKLAQKVAEARGRPVKLTWPTPPTSAAGSERNRLTQQARAIEEALTRWKEFDPRDELVPTTFDVNQLDDVTNQRRDHAFTLWRWGEGLKVKLGRGDSTTFQRIDRNMKGLAEALLKGLSDVQAQQLVGQIEKITISRWEVDALVEAQVLKSIKNCNNLIRDHLTMNQPDDAEEEVHWVVVTGNASQYPLIQELLRRELHVPFINQDRFTLEERNLKHAVAKGAVLALSTISAMGTVQIEFDSDLSNCLPFDVAYKDLRNNTYPILYREHLRYDRLEKKPIPIISIRSQAASTRKLEKFVLERRFPGDESFSPFLTFHFPDGIHGDLEVAYDPEQREFTVRDTSANVFGEQKDVTDNSIYRSPAQRGDL